jgi:hypothetical protein
MTFPNGTEKVRAVPFRTGADFSVFDHLKYIEVSNSAFPAPAKGSVEFSVDITAQTPGTVTPLTQQGIYGPSGTWTDPSNPPQAPNYSANVLEGQQAGVVLNMVDFCTGQLFDWFLTTNTAFTLIERLPTNVTGNTSNPGCPGASFVGRQKMYTQIADEVKISGGPHNVSIRYSAKQNSVEYLLDGKVVTRVYNVGIPLDKQGVKYTGIYPSLGPRRVARWQDQLVLDRTRAVQPDRRLPLPAPRVARAQRLHPGRNLQSGRRRAGSAVRPGRRRNVGQLHRHDHRQGVGLRLR